MRYAARQTDVRTVLHTACRQRRIQPSNPTALRCSAALDNTSHNRALARLVILKHDAYVVVVVVVAAQGTLELCSCV